MAKENTAARDHAIRQVHLKFIKALPQPARLNGSVTIAPDSLEAGQHPVSDGSYRVLGSDWVMHFKGGKWAGANRAHARGAPDWTEIADA